MPWPSPSPAVFALVAGVMAACQHEPAWRDPHWVPVTPPQRIVAASVFAAEVLLDLVPRERIAAVHVLAADARYSPVAERVRGLPVVGADPEQLLTVRPDLVVCDPFTRPETLALLGAAGVPVVTTAAPVDFADIAANVTRLGALCHRPAAAVALVGAMQERLRALTASRGTAVQWRVVNLDGALHTYGRGALFTALLEAAGARPLAAERGVGPFRRLDVETLLAWQPDAIVLNGESGKDDVPPWIAQHPGLSLLRCVQARRFVRVAASKLNATSPQLVEAVADVQRQLVAWGTP